MHDGRANGQRTENLVSNIGFQRRRKCFRTDYSGHVLLHSHANKTQCCYGMFLVLFAITLNGGLEKYSVIHTANVYLRVGLVLRMDNILELDGVATLMTDHPRGNFVY